MYWFFLVLSVLFAVAGYGELYPQTFSCRGEIKDDLCWLNDPRLYSLASWSFQGITPGNWNLVLWGVGNDLCRGCSAGRDILVQVFWREAPHQPWNWTFVTLRNVQPEKGAKGYRVQAEIPLRLHSPELTVLAKRVLVCQPFLGFSRNSAYLLAPAAPEIPTLPTAPTPPPPPPPQPPTLACQIGPLFACQPAGLPAECIPADLDLAKVGRTKLADTYGPADAQVLELGHYLGELSGDDYQDWYKFSVHKGEARVVYFRVIGDLVVDLYLVHDPCAIDLSVCLNVREEAVLYGPCQAGLKCEIFPEGPTECFPGEWCRFFIRIVRRSGSGTYYISILPGNITP